jgi:hypothetical protein
MQSEKTPLQIIQYYIQQQHAYYYKRRAVSQTDAAKSDLLGQLLLQVQAQLPNEKKIIEQAHDNGMASTLDGTIITGSEYYEERFGEKEVEDTYGWITPDMEAWTPSVVGFAVLVHVLDINRHHQEALISSDYQNGWVSFSQLYKTEADCPTR